MNTENNSKAASEQELDKLRRRVAELETAEAKRKQANNGLRKSEEMLRHFVDASTEGIHILDSELKLLFINQFALGNIKQASPDIKSADDLIGKHLAQIYLFVEEQGWDLKFLKVLETGEALVEDAAFPHPVMGILYLEILAFKLFDGLGFVVRDFSERKQAAKMLKASNDQLEHMLASSPTVIYSLQANGDLDATFVSKNFQSHWGYNPDEFTGGQDFWQNHIHPEDRDHILANLPQLFQTGKHSHEYRFQHKDQSYRWVRDDLRLIYDAENKPVEIIGAWTDITDRKQYEQDHFLLAIEKERVKLLSDFTTQASHEFRTPLSIININAQLIERSPSSVNQKQYLSKIRQQVVNLTTLIENMQTLSTLDSLQIQNSKIIDLNQMLRDIHSSKQSSLHDRDLKSRLELNSTPLMIEGDSKYLGNAIKHIWDNAIRYTPAGGRVIIRSNLADANAVIEIADTGIGIGEDDLPHIFERFFRIDKAGSTRGFGLGLPIVKAVIEQFGGHIEVESKAQEGSTFRIFLPTV